ncbi:hypothetical protein SNEBB_003952 [Seison nebaliae]|nr:hypothetical protein SNEBB_003952 [Seison nebaliae]
MLRVLLKLNPLIKSEIDISPKTHEIWTNQNISKTNGFTVRIIEDIAMMLQTNFILNISTELAYGLEDVSHHQLTGISGKALEYDIIGLLNDMEERKKYLDFIKVLDVVLNFNYNQKNELLYSPFNQFIQSINYEIFILAFFLSIISIILLHIINEKCSSTNNTTYNRNRRKLCFSQTKKSLTEIRRKWILIFGNFRNINIKLNTVWKTFQISWWFGAIVFSSQVIALFISIITKLQQTDLSAQQIFNGDINFIVSVNSTTSRMLRNYVSSKRIIEVDTIFNHVHRLENENVVIASFGDYSTYLTSRYCNIKKTTYDMYVPTFLGLAMRNNHPLINHVRYIVRTLDEVGLLKHYFRTEKSYTKIENCANKKGMNMIFFSQLKNFFLFFCCVDFFFIFYHILGYVLLKLRNKQC